MKTILPQAMKTDATGAAISAPSLFSRITAAALELLYPGAIYCVACGNLIDASRPYALCDTCRHEIAWQAGFLPDKHEFDNGYFCAQYNGPVKNMVRDMKYRDKPYIAKSIAEVMAERAAGEKGIMDADIILPVPMHPAKKRKRGYNQTELIAAGLAESLGIAYAPELLIKTRATEAMSSKNSDERRLMLTDAFSVRNTVGADNSPSLRGSRVLLIDDVFTTGSTADACAQTLHKAGAASVNIFVFATGALGGAR